MRPLRGCVVLVALTMGIGCGSEAGNSTTRASNPTNANPNGIGPATDNSQPPRDMAGGGRGSMGPHEKGK
jgi:hypothetical protein